MSDHEWVKNQLVQQTEAISNRQPYHGPTVGLVMAAALLRIKELEETLQTILANTEPGAIKHRDYDHLATDIADAARAVLE